MSWSSLHLALASNSSLLILNLLVARFGGHILFASPSPTCSSTASSYISMNPSFVIARDNSIMPWRLFSPKAWMTHLMAYK
jgi:hypothetical protein